MTPWEEMASGQGVWSGTADNLKRNLARARWITLCLSVLGALLAANRQSDHFRSAAVRAARPAIRHREPPER